MASTFFGLTISYSGLQASNKAINVTAHNLSNINTEGYSKQATVQKAENALRTYSRGGALGSGVIVTEVKQLRDSYYDTKYRNNNTKYGEFATKSSYMNQIQDYLDEYTLKGFATEYSNFFKAVEQVKNQPEEASTRNQLINNAKSLADYFNTLSTNLRNVQIDANNEVKDAVQQINSIAKNIASLNKQINQIETTYGNANDLRDQRNQLIDELSEIVNIDISERELGQNMTELSVYIDGQPLVIGNSHDVLEVVSRGDTKRNASDADGLYDIQWQSGQNFNIYSSSLGGHLKALIDLRDGCNSQIESYKMDDNGNYILDSDGNKIYSLDIQADKNISYKGVPYYQAQLNYFITTFSQAVNDILKQGYSYDGEHGGISLFVTMDGTDTLNASTVTVNAELLKDPAKLAIKDSISTGEANSKIMEQIQELEKAKIFNGGVGSYFLESIVGDMSIDTNNASNMLDNYNNLKNSIQNQRLSIMGVDTEEEGMDLLKFQQAYNLNSKMLSVMNEIYDKLINQTGV